MRRTPRDEARQARTGVYRQHILEAAERVFADRGFDTAKVQEISQLAGLSMGTIYAIFPSKQELHRAILEARGHQLLGLAREVASRRLPPRDALRALIEVYVDYFLAHPAFLRMHLRSGTSWAMSPSPGTDEQIEKRRCVGLVPETARESHLASASLEDAVANLQQACCLALELMEVLREIQTESRVREAAKGRSGSNA